MIFHDKTFLEVCLNILISEKGNLSGHPWKIVVVVFCEFCDEGKILFTIIVWCTCFELALVRMVFGIPLL